MTEADQSDRFLLAQHVFDLLRELHVDPTTMIDSYEIDSDFPEGIPIIRLTVIRNAQKIVTYFRDKEMLDGFGTEDWKKRIRERLDRLIRNG